MSPAGPFPPWGLTRQHLGTRSASRLAQRGHRQGTRAAPAWHQEWHLWHLTWAKLLIYIGSLRLDDPLGCLPGGLLVLPGGTGRAPWWHWWRSPGGLVVHVWCSSEGTCFFPPGAPTGPLQGHHRTTTGPSTTGPPPGQPLGNHSHNREGLTSGIKSGTIQPIAANQGKTT